MMRATSLLQDDSRAPKTCRRVLTVAVHATMYLPKEPTRRGPRPRAGDVNECARDSGGLAVPDTDPSPRCTCVEGHPRWLDVASKKQHAVHCTQLLEQEKPRAFGIGC